MRTLVLNAGYEPLQLVGWQRAMCLILSEKAEVVSDYGDVVRTVTAEYELPSVIRLKRYVCAVKRFGIVRCTRKNILIRDRHHCQYCGVHCKSSNVTIDHILPRSLGGKTVWSNVVAACHSCNRKKGDRLLHRSGFALKTKPKSPIWYDLIDEFDELAAKDWLPFLKVAG